MPDDTPTDPLGGTPPSSGTKLNPAKIPSVLANFQTWLEALATAPEDNGQVEAEAAEEIDLATLLGQMIAIRQETNLLTRATRTQQEHNQETLTQLSSALQMLQRSQTSAKQLHESNLEEQTRPLLRTLVDLYEVLTLSSGQVQRIREELLPQVEALVERTTTSEVAPLPKLPEPAPRGWFSFGHNPEPPSDEIARKLLAMLEEERRDRAEMENQTHEVAERLQAMLGSVVDGYRLSVQRLQRTLAEHNLEPMDVVGEPFDPELMEVVEVVSDGDYEPGEVVEEVSRGYLWQGRVFRYAKVRVAKPSE